MRVWSTSGLRTKRTGNSSQLGQGGSRFYTCENRSGNSRKRLTRAIRRVSQTNDVAASNTFALQTLRYERCHQLLGVDWQLVLRPHVKTLNFPYNKNLGCDSRSRKSDSVPRPLQRRYTFFSCGVHHGRCRRIQATQPTLSKFGCRTRRGSFLVSPKKSPQSRTNSPVWLGSQIATSKAS
jgi:hypothetical protein